MSASAILDHTGKPFQKRNGHVRPELAVAFINSRGRGRNIRASYDAARSTDDMDGHWVHADALDADSANNPQVRSKLVTRSRYEAGSNGYFDGLIQTHANYVVGTGPNLRMKTPSKAFNETAEAAWKAWCKATLFRRKLWCLACAKPQDGEGLGVIRGNQAVPHPVKLDFVPFETEQCQTPYLPFNVAGRVDGIYFDEFNNPTFYDILKYHPGGAWSYMQPEPEKVPAAYVVHWFTLRRPGQHRAVPEFRSTLNVGAKSRRWREATIVAAETAADYAALLHTDMPPESTADLAAPFSTVPIERGQMAALPMGWEPAQMRAEHPNATYESFHRQQVNETARPKSIPQNIAMCDSSGYNFASGKLDHETYFLTVDIEREDANDLVLDKIFARWWELAVLVYGWAAEPDAVPDHGWDWPKHPVGDIRAVAAANDIKLKNGTLSPSRAASEIGEDFEDQVIDMARDYGVSVDEMRAIILRTNLAGAAPKQPAAIPGARQPIVEDDEEEGAADE